MQKIELGTLEHTVERIWVAEPVQGRQQVIRVGRLATGGWWVDRRYGPRTSGAWACGDEVQAEAVAHRWSCQSRLRWRPAAVGTESAAPG